MTVLVFPPGQNNRQLHQAQARISRRYASPPTARSPFARVSRARLLGRTRVAARITSSSVGWGGISLFFSSSGGHAGAVALGVRAQLRLLRRPCLHLLERPLHRRQRRWGLPSDRRTGPPRRRHCGQPSRGCWVRCRWISRSSRSVIRDSEFSCRCNCFAIWVFFSILQGELFCLSALVWHRGTLCRLVQQGRTMACRFFFASRLALAMYSGCPSVFYCAAGSTLFLKMDSAVPKGWCCCQVMLSS